MLKALKSSLNQIFIDESVFNLFNDYFHSWIKKDSAYQTKLPNQKIKLILLWHNHITKYFFMH